MPTTASLIARRYRLERVVGRGGMGEVWLAQDVVLGRPVAAKRIGARDASERELLRARQEARVTAMLDHEHVVRVFDLVVEDGEQWLVMELVESENLGRLVRRTGPLDVVTAARLGHQAAQALAAAHQSGIVHRDVKPSNLLVTPSWHVKLGDFGIARLEGDVGTTRTGQLVGSPGYLAPEVGTGRSATPASDMWSLGATLFHAVEGHAPYRTEGGNVMGTLYRIINEPPPTPQRAGWLEPVIRHLLVHDPEARWTAQQVVSHLGEALATAPNRSRPPAPATLDHQPLADEGATSMLPVVPVPAEPEAPPQPPSGSPAQPALATWDDVTAAGPGRRRAAPAPTAAPPRRRGLIGVAVVVAVLIVAAVAGLALRQQSRSDGTTAGATPPAASPSAGPTRPTTAGITSFVRDYLSTAPSDPEQGFDRLTPAYQADSKGLSGYRSFWGTVASATATRIDADPGALTVAYDVDYRFDDGTRDTDSVRLRLALRDGRYLIAGELQ